MSDSPFLISSSGFICRYVGHELMPSIRQPLMRTSEVFLNTFMLNVFGESIR